MKKLEIELRITRDNSHMSNSQHISFICKMKKMFRGLLSWKSLNEATTRCDLKAVACVKTEKGLDIILIG